MSISRTLGGAALLLAALLNLTRMIPIFANMPEGFEGFPPQTAEQIALLHLGNTSGVILSHLMALISFPLYFIGFLFLYSRLRERNQHNLGLPALVSLGAGLALFTVAVIIDGFILHRVAEYFLAAPEASRETASFLVDITHHAALRFMAPAVFALMTGLGLLACALIRSHLYSRWGGWIGVGLGALAVAGYCTGLTGVHWDQMQVSGPLIMVHHIWYVWLGISILRQR